MWFDTVYLLKNLYYKYVSHIIFAIKTCFFLCCETNIMAEPKDRLSSQF